MIIEIFNLIISFFAALVFWFIIKPIFWLMRIFRGREYTNSQKDIFINWLYNTSYRVKKN